MFDKHAIETFKWTNKPTWHKVTPSLVVAKWVINGETWIEAINPQVSNYTHGWTYKPNGE